MGIIGESLMAAVGGAAQQGTKVLNEQIKSDIDLQEAKALAEFRNQLQQSNMHLAETIRREGAQSDIDRNADPANVKKSAEASAQGEVDRVNTPGFLDAVGKEARAKHVESAASAADARLTQLKIDQLKEADDWRKKAGDMALTPEERENARDMVQLLSGKDADRWEIVKSKDNLGVEQVVGRQNKTTGEFQRFTGTGFAASERGGEGKKPWEKYSPGAPATAPSADSTPAAPPSKKPVDTATQDDAERNAQARQARREASEKAAAERSKANAKRAAEADEFNRRLSGARPRD